MRIKKSAVDVGDYEFDLRGGGEGRAGKGVVFGESHVSVVEVLFGWQRGRQTAKNCCGSWERRDRGRSEDKLSKAWGLLYKK